MIYFLIFASELILLFIISKKLINALARIIYKLTKSHKVVVHTLAILFLPGTIIHELGHLLFAGVMLVPVGELSVMPEIEETGAKLGSVQIGQTDPLRRMVIGVAPILLGMILIFSIFLLVKIGISPWWQVFLALYFIFQIANTMFSSRKDLEGAIGFLAIVTVAIIILIVLYFFNPTLIGQMWLWLNTLDLEMVSSFFKTASIYLILPVVLDLSIILLTLLCAPGRNRTLTLSSEATRSIH